MSNNKTTSLISYLSPANGFHLDICRCGIEESRGGETEYKFEEFFDSDPFCRLIHAGIVGNGKSHIKKVFLLMQKEVYLHPTDEPRPVTNSMIERYWQRAFKMYGGNDNNRDTLILAGETDRPDLLTLWQSLFFCHHRQIFFHPPCPVCGHFLHLCRDDKILTGMGLRPYSTSLKRYLYCPFCHDVAGQSDFFTYDLTKSDPSFVNDRRDLIRKLGRLKSGSDKPYHFPCPDCSEREKCHGQDGIAKTRIEIFNFYPSYMMIFPGGLINAIDFLALVSGASGGQLQNYLAGKNQNGRIKCLQASGVLKDYGPYFMFRQSSRFFLEVLYLKLNFLASLFENMVPVLENLSHPDLGLSLDRFWVKTAPRTGLVPHLWNFTVHRIDLGDAGSHPLQIPKNPPSYGFYFLGTTWFFTLLANSRQEPAVIYTILPAVMDPEGHDPGISTAEFETALNNPVFSPENIFWNSGEVEIPESMNKIWIETLKTGRLLLNGHVYHGTNQDVENLRKKLTALLKTVKRMLLPPAGENEKTAEKTEVKEISDKDNQIICNILDKIRCKWSAPFEEDSKKQDLSGQLPTDQIAAYEMKTVEPEFDLDETVIIGNKHGDSPRTAHESHTSPAPIPEKKSEFTIKTAGVPEKELICETVVLSPDFFKETDEIEETLVLSPANIDKTPGAEKDNFAETMIQSPGADMQNKTDLFAEKNKEEHRPAAKNAHLEDDLPETVILSPKPKNRK